MLNSDGDNCEATVGIGRDLAAGRCEIGVGIWRRELHEGVNLSVHFERRSAGELARKLRELADWVQSVSP